MWWYTTSDIIMLVIGGVVLLASLVAFLALLIPSLGRRIYGRYWPGTLADPGKRRKGYLGITALISMIFCFSLLELVDKLSYTVCIPRDTLDRGRISIFLIFITILFILLLRNWKYRNTKEIDDLNKVRLSRPIRIIGLIGLIVSCSLFFFVFAKYILSPYTPDSQIDRVAMVSETEGWAIGNFMSLGVLYHYDHGVWRELEPPYTSNLQDIEMLSPDQGWIVGDVILHYRDEAWSEVPSPVKRLNGIDMLSADEGWAVGDGGTIVRYTQGRWAQVASPTDEDLADISMISADEGWAVGGGYRSSSASVILHYQNGQWRLVDSPVAESLNRVQMLSADSGWALGGSRRDPTTSVLLRYQNRAWQPIPSPVPIPLTDLAMVSETEGWAVGGDYFSIPFGCADGGQSKLLNALLHYQDGVWTSIASPSSKMMQGISMLDADNGLLVGRGVVLRYAEGRWREAELEPLP